MNYAWIITADFLGEASAIGTTGPRGHTTTPEKIKANGERFRMKDDDGEVYYEGCCVHEGDEVGVFGPLDDFGTPNAGCTTIEYMENGKWTVM